MSKKTAQSKTEEHEAGAADEGSTGAKPARDERKRAKRKADDHADDHTHDVAPVDTGDDTEDPMWWAPHAVLGVIVLLGMLGFFGVFNNVLGFLKAKPTGAVETTETTNPAKPAEPAKPAAPTPKAPVPPPSPLAANDPAAETFGAKHLLVMYKGSLRAPPTIARSQEEAKKRAEEAAKRAKGGKEKFEDLVKEFSDEPGAGERGGDLGNFRRGAMVPEFQTALDKMKVGEISDVVETKFGYHVILRTK